MTRTLRLLPSMALLLATSGCQESDSILLVNLDCDPAAAPSNTIRVTLSEPTHLYDTKTFPVETSGTPLPFPTSLVLMIPRSHSGLLDLAILALDANSATVAHATAQVTLSTGAQTTLSVTLAAGNDLCGNGILDPGEVCDDRNLYSFDGCDFNCQPEATSRKPQVDAGSPETGSMDSSPLPDTLNIPDSSSPDLLPSDATIPDSSLPDLLPPDTAIPDTHPADLLPPANPDLATDSRIPISRHRPPRQEATTRPAAIGNLLLERLTMRERLL